MKRNKADNSCLGRFRFIHVVLLVILCFVLLMSLEAPALFKPNLIPYSHAALSVIEAGNIDAIRSGVSVMKDASNQHRRFVIPRVSQVGPEIDAKREQSSAIKEEERKLSEKEEHSAHGGTQRPLPDLRTVAAGAWASGAVAWKEMEEAIAGRNSTISHVEKEGIAENCPKMLLLSGEDLKNAGNIMMLPCGLVSGSSITVIAKPKKGHIKPRPNIARVVDDVKNVIVSQFILELQGLKMVDGEDPPRILHVNPRLKGDWSGRPVIELNTCYRGQWGTAQRCEGWVSPDDEDAVDGLAKCQRWIQNDNDTSEDSKSTWWNKLIGHSAKSSVEWTYPFVEEQLFVLTIRAGWEGYHISADGKHVASFPYRTGFILEEATGFTISGDIDVHSIVATSLPYSHLKFPSPQIINESETLRALPLPKTPVDLFIGILSASTHFAERMAVRKTWMQSKSIRSSGVVARFFVGMHPHKDINMQVKEEADYFGDMVILPFMDHYDLVVLKTIAICEYGVKNISARHIMKTDDDTFVRVEKILNMVRVARKARGLYMGNINQFHRPLRVGKWAVTYEEWPEEEYPPYANGPGYVISSDIAKFVLSQHENNTLRLFKMEDVSMGMWVVQFNQYYAVHYVHNLKFCQWGCVEDYFTAHYQSPRQMLCMWEKLREGEAQCCNMR